MSPLHPVAPPISGTRSEEYAPLSLFRPGKLDSKYFFAPMVLTRSKKSLAGTDFFVSSKILPLCERVFAANHSRFLKLYEQLPLLTPSSPPLAQQSGHARRHITCAEDFQI